MNQIAKSISIATHYGSQVIEVTEVKQLYVFGNSLIVSGSFNLRDQTTEKFMLKDLKSIHIEF